MMQAILQQLNILARTEKLNSRDLALIVEANQRYDEYLEWLETAELPESKITLNVDGTTIRFESIDNMANWLAENLT